MLTREDCIAFCGLTDKEVLAIAEHEHVPKVIAAEMAEERLDAARGIEEIRNMIVDDIRSALARDDKKHAAELFACLHHFVATHPVEIGGSRI